MSKETKSGSLGILGGLNKLSEEGKKDTSKEVKKEPSEEAKIKRSYALNKSTIMMLGELKLFNFSDKSLETIVDDAIREYYENHRGK